MSDLLSRLDLAFCVDRDHSDGKNLLEGVEG